MPPEQPISRRRLLSGTTVVLLGVAGCGQGGGDDGTDEPTTTVPPTTSTTQATTPATTTQTRPETTTTGRTTTDTPATTPPPTTTTTTTTTTQPTTTPPGVETSTVDMVDFQFDPRNVHVDNGPEVTWINQDSTSHTVTNASDNWSKDTVVEGGGETTHTFTDSDVYDVYCRFHGSADLSGMSMKISVGDATIQDPLG